MAEKFPALYGTRSFITAITKAFPVLSLHASITLFENKFQSYFPAYTQAFQVISLPNDSLPKLYVHLLSPICGS
jgi:hypothetical protein